DPGRASVGSEGRACADDLDRTPARGTWLGRACVRARRADRGRSGATLRRDQPRDRAPDPALPRTVSVGLQPLQAAARRRAAGGGDMSRIVIAILWLLHWLPLPLLAPLGRAFGGLLYVFVRRRRHVVAVNLRLCFPELGDAG